LHVSTEGLPAFDHAWQTMEMEIMPTWLLQKHLGVTLACGEWDVVENAFTTSQDFSQATHRIRSLAELTGIVLGST